MEAVYMPINNCEWMGMVISTKLIMPEWKKNDFVDFCSPHKQKFGLALIQHEILDRSNELWLRKKINEKVLHQVIRSQDYDPRLVDLLASLFIW